jgi:UDP-glucose 4-epimerase
VLWAGRDPRLGGAAWRPDEDAELAFARRVVRHDARFLTLSTRKVYAPGQGRLREDAPPAPGDLYGRQKLLKEEALLDLLGARLTRLRLANIFGFEDQPDRRSSMAAMMRSLGAEGVVRFDMSPFTRRGFLPVALAGRWIAALLRRSPGGIVHVGSGIALETGRLALWLIAGFGVGRLVVEEPRERDAFVLDTARLQGLVGERCACADVRAAAMAIGRRRRG